MKWYVRCLRRYVDFRGRSTRTEYWMFSLINFLISAVMLIPVLLVMRGWSGTFDQQFVGAFNTASTPVNIYGLATFIPGIAVQVRRLHDVGKSGWWYFIALIPLAGAIVLLIFNCTDSEPGPNKWGDNQKGTPGGAAVAVT